MREPEPLELTVERRGASTVVQVAGEVDFATAPRFETFLHDHLARTRAVLMIELSGVNRFGSTWSSPSARSACCGRSRSAA